ncbi:MAG: recombinase family protein [Acidobacteriota bacterium]
MSQKKISHLNLNSENPATFLPSSKIAPHHWERLAVVYIRQSSIQQVNNNVESTQLQYGLQNKAQQLGWSKERVLIIDEDLGRSGTSIEARPGFQRLVTEVGLNHVGIIIGIEMSRLARSCKDWHQLLEICALFGTLIADMDGIYDPSLYNDRLLLGLKGTMSEAELHIIKQRLYQGKLNKARRGEIIHILPIGYIRRPNGEVCLDPDEQVQSTVRLIFQKFSEYGTINGVLQYLAAHHIQIGVRLHSGPEKGDLVWRRANRMTLSNMLHHPIYAGAYTFGRRQIDPKGKQAGRSATGRVVMPPEKWLVLIKDQFPSYISWEQYLLNQKRLESNQNRASQLGAIRHGPSILTGLVICSFCKRRMGVKYPGNSNNKITYMCTRPYSDYGEKSCQRLSGEVLNEFVSEQVLKALEPASLELSLRAAQALEKQRRQLEQLFEQRLDRARYEAERAARQYRLVEPENRLVARQLEKEWEEKLKAHKALEEEYNRYLSEQPKILSVQEQEEIRSLAHSIPALWSSVDTTDAERKAIVRHLVEKIEVEIIGNSEQVQVIIYWKGSRKSEHKIIRPVSSWEKMSQYDKLRDHLKQLVKEGLTSRQIAEQLNKEGWKPPKRRVRFGDQGVRELLVKMGVSRVHRSKRYCEYKLKKNEWWIPELAKHLGMPRVTLHHWVYRGWVKARQLDGLQGRWIVWADNKELKRLKQLHDLPQGHWSRKHFFEGKEQNR